MDKKNGWPVPDAMAMPSNLEEEEYAKMDAGFGLTQEEAPVVEQQTTPANVPVVPQPIWGSLRNSESNKLADPEWWFFYRGQMHPMRACFSSSDSIPVSDFISMPFPAHHNDPRVIFGEGRVTMKVPAGHAVAVGEIYPTMTLGEEVATLRVHEVVMRFPPDGYKDIVFTRADDVPERPISAPAGTPALTRKPKLKVTNAETGAVVTK